MDPNETRNEGNMHSFLQFVDNYFKISERNSTIMTELKSGILNFIALSYIIILNPHLLAVSDIPINHAISSTCLSSCISTLICGIFGNIPVGCAPAIGLSAYFSYSIIQEIKDQNYSSTDPYLAGLFLSFLSGLIVFILSIPIKSDRPGIIQFIVVNIPNVIKTSIIVGIGVFLALIAMSNIDLITQSNDENVFLKLGDITDWKIILSLCSLLGITISKYVKKNGSILTFIIITSLIYFAASNDWPTQFITAPKFQNPGKIFNINIIKHIPIWASFKAILSFLLILFLDISGVTFVIALISRLHANNPVHFQKYAFAATGIGSMIAAVLGCSPIIIPIECVYGVVLGARTGLSAVVLSFCFFVAMFLSPVIAKIPAVATSPVLIFIGAMMMGTVFSQKIKWDNPRISIPAFLCIIITAFSYSIANGLLFGMIGYLVIFVFSGQFLIKWKWFQDMCFNGNQKTLDEQFGYSSVSVNKETSHSNVEPDFPNLSYSRSDS
eukprot:282246_1